MQTSREQHLYTVGELCERFAITRKTLFYYDRAGLLKPAKRTGSQNYKLYDAASLIRLERILEYREAGLSIQEIRCLLDASCSDPTAVLKQALVRLQKERDAKTVQIKNLQALIRKLGR